MKNCARLLSVVELVELVLDKDVKTPADDLFVNYCRHRRYIGSKDRHFLAEYFFNVIRHYQGLITVLKGATTPRLLVLTYWYYQNQSFEDLKHEEKSPYGIALPNSHEQDIILRASKQLKDHLFDVEEWTLKHFSKYGASATKQIEALHQQASFDIRINPLLTTREAVLLSFKREGIKAHKTELSPFGLRLEERIPLQNLDLWKDGHIEIQDEGAQLISVLSDVQENHTVLDYCAGAGGKTLLMAALMNNKGRIIATDKYLYRLEQGKKRYRRAQVHNVQIKALEDAKWWKRHKSSFDRVLIDVPCSGSGTWRRNPDLKIRFKEKDLKELVILQQEIMNTAKTYVKKGGYLIYATCSMWGCENEEQIKRFLTANPDFKILNVKNTFKTLSINESSCITSMNVEDCTVQLTPYDHQVDGFFISILQRVE